MFVQTYRKYAYPDSKLAKIGALTNGERVKPGGRGPPDKYTPEKDAIKKNTKNRKRRRNLRPRAAAKKAKQLRRELDDTGDENDEGDSEYDPAEEEEKAEEDNKGDAKHGVRHVNSTAVATIPQTDTTSDLVQQLKRLIDSAGAQEKKTAIITKSSPLAEALKKAGSPGSTSPNPLSQLELLVESQVEMTRLAEEARHSADQAEMYRRKYMLVHQLMSLLQ